MGISATNLIVTGNNKKLDKQVEKEPVVKTYVDNIKEPSVIVDGKVKKIGKKSAFLLDMLTLDD